MWNHHCSIIPVLDSGTKFCNSSGGVLCFQFTIILSRDMSKGFHLAFPTIIALSQQVRETRWEFCRLLNTSVSIMHTEAGKIITGTYLNYSELKFSQNFINHLISMALTLTGGPQYFLGSPAISVNSEPVSNTVWKLWLFPFAQGAVTLSKSYRSLWGRIGERLT